MRTKHGFVYVLGNECMPGVYKIGFTTGHPKNRAAELSAATACPTPFEVLAYIGREDPQAIESGIHQELDSYRVDSSREFFRVDLRVIQNTFRGWSASDEVFMSEPMDRLCDRAEMAVLRLVGKE